MFTLSVPFQICHFWPRIRGWKESSSEAFASCTGWGWGGGQFYLVGPYQDTHLGEGVRCAKHSCSLCSKSFTRIGSLRRHMRIHREERLHKCLHCKKFFVQQITCIDIWEFAMGRDHINVLNAPCLSENRIPYKIMLEVTRERKGTYSCDHCPKKFSRSHALKNHIRSHPWRETVQLFILCKNF